MLLHIPKISRPKPLKGLKEPAIFEMFLLNELKQKAPLGVWGKKKFQIVSGLNYNGSFETASYLLLI